MGYRPTKTGFDQIKGINGAISLVFNFVLAREYNRQISACSACSPKQLQGALCGDDGKTYNTECELIQVGCSNVISQSFGTFRDFSS